MNHARNSLLARPDRCRFALGLAMSACGRQIRAALVGATGHGLEMRLEPAAALIRAMPARLVRRMRRYRRQGPTNPAQVAILAAEIAEFQAAVVDELAEQNPGLAPRLLAAGVLDPGYWAQSRSGLTAYLPLSDAARLADLTGMNVIDAFPTRDLAQEGRGRPLGTLPDWLLFHHPSRTRAIIDLGRTTRVTLLPAARDAAGAERVSTLVAGPGMALLDRLARRLTEGAERFDSGGHLAVQGQRIGPCFGAWMAACESEASGAPRQGTLRETRSLVDEALMQARDADWSIQDLLCTATHLVAELTARAIDLRLPAEPAVEEVIVTGGGQHNGLLMRELAARLAPLPVALDSELGMPDGARDAAVAATLALLHLDHTPASPTGITGARTPRVLGRLTPGSPQNWQRLLREMTGQATSVVSLRSAI